MVDFLVILTVSVVALLVVRSLDVECVNPPRKRQPVAARRVVKADYGAGLPANRAG